MDKKDNIILTGIPRSGTTLACYLLSKIEDVVALIEPLSPKNFATLSDVEFIEFLDNFFYKQRGSVLTEKVVNSRSVRGGMTDNVVSKGLDQKTGRRVKIIDGDTLYIEKKLSKNFTLFIKHPSFFSAKLELLSRHYKCYAVIRNPLAVLLSWNSVEMAVSDGHAPAAEEYDIMLKNALTKEKDKFDRQLVLLSWFYMQYFTHLNSELIIKYEDMISSNGKELQKLVGKSFSYSGEELISRNNSSIYSHELKLFLKNKLLHSEGAYWNYYKRSDLEL